MIKKLNYLLAVGAITLTASCTSMQPINNELNQPVPSSMTRAQVSEAILAVCGAEGWKVSQNTLGKIVATYQNNDEQLATVEITFSEMNYNITYVSSKEMDQEDSEIDANYNAWVNELSGAIQKELNQVSSSDNAQATSLSLIHI